MKQWQQFALGIAAFAVAGGINNARADFPSAVKALGPVGYYRLNTTNPVPAELFATNSGSLGAAFNGAYVQMAAARGVPGAILGDPNTAVETDGASRRVVVPFSTTYNLQNAFTIEAWLNPGSDAGSLSAPLNSAHMADPRAGWILYQNGTVGWSFRMYNRNGLTVSLQLDADAPITVGTWYHLAMTYDGTTARVYVNGVEKASGQPAGAPAYVANPDGPLVIGARSDFAFPWKGKADEVAVYNAPLSAGDVLAHYQNGTNPSRTQPYDVLVKAANPVLYYRLSEPALQLPIAKNEGTSGAAYNGTYMVGTTSGLPGLQRPATEGFETTNAAAGFNGVSGSVSIPGLPINSDTVTMMCWFKRDGVQPARAALMHNRKVTAPEVKATGLQFLDNGLGLCYNWEDQGTAYNFNPNFIPPDKAWTFFAVTVAPYEQILYMGTADGLVKATNSFAIFPHDFSGTTLELGWDNYQATRIFRGAIDEFAMFDKTLSDLEITSLFNAALPAILALNRTPADPVYEGMNATFDVEASGTPTAYQWRKGGSPLPGQTAATLTLTGVTLGDSGNYDVQVTTGGKTLTSPAETLTVQTSPPILTQTPQSTVRYLNGQVSFSVAAIGSQPLSYQWKHGDTVIPGATSSTLTVSDLVAADAGQYTVIVSNPHGSREASATLTIQTPSKLGAMVVNGGPVGYWRLDETTGTTAYDFWGGRDGTLSAGVTNNLPGPRPAAFAGFDPANTAYAFAGNTAHVAIPPLNINKATVTIVAWIKPQGVQADYAGIVFSRGATATGLDFKGTTGYLGYHWNDTAASYNWESGLMPIPDQWNFVALVVEPTQATMYLDDGTGAGLVSVANYVAHNPASFADPLRLGVDSPNGSRAFTGMIDDVAVYDRSLSLDEVTALRNAGFNGTYSQTPVSIVQQPRSQGIAVGSSYTMTAKAKGSVPLAYQWKKNGQNIPGAIRASLTFVNAAESDSGTYQLFVTQGATTVSTVPATLTVKPAPSYINLPENLVLHLKFDGNYQDSSGRNNHGTPQGTPQITPGRIGSGALRYSTIMEAGSVTAANFVTLGTPADLAIGPNVNFSTAFWVKFTGTPGDLPFLGNTYNSYGDPGLNFAPSWEEGSWSWYMNDKDASAWQGVGLYSPVKMNMNDGQWHHLVHVFDRPHEAVTYLDGVKVNITGIGTAAGWDLTTANEWVIGQTVGGYYAVAGDFQIDDLGFWRRALTEWEAQGIYRVGTYGRSFDTTAPPSVKITLTVNGNNLTLAWPNGTLESSDTVDGQWTAVSGASAPSYTTQMGTGNKFYRVRVE